MASTLTGPHRRRDANTVLLFDFLRPGRTMADLDELPADVAAQVERRTQPKR